MILASLLDILRRMEPLQQRITQNATTICLSELAEYTGSAHWEAPGSDNGVTIKCYYLTLPSVISTQISAPFPSMNP